MNLTSLHSTSSGVLPGRTVAMAIDDRGRLFLCESSGNTLTTPQMAAKPDYQIRMVEDTNGDGIGDLRMRVTERVHGDARGEVEIALAIGGGEPAALAALEAEIDPGEDGEQMRRGAMGHGNH